MRIGIDPEYLLDTNIVLELFHGIEPTKSIVSSWIAAGKIAVSAITYSEIISKASIKEKQNINLLVTKFGTIPVDQNVAEIAGEYRKEFLRKTNRVYLLDCLIAATAKLYNLKLVTKNVKDYPMKDIEIINSGI